MTVQIDPATLATLEQLVAEGRFASVEEALSEAVALLQQKDVGNLRRLLQNSSDDATDRDGNDVFAELRDRLAKRRSGRNAS